MFEIIILIITVYLSVTIPHNNLFNLSHFIKMENFIGESS